MQNTQGSAWPVHARARQEEVCKHNAQPLAVTPTHLLQEVKTMKDRLGVMKKKESGPHGGVHDGAYGCAACSPSGDRASPLPSEPGSHSG